MLLTDCLELYGRRFDYRRYGVDTTATAATHSRADLRDSRDWTHNYKGPSELPRRRSAWALHVRDPVNCANDLGAPTWLLPEVAACFAQAADELRAAGERTAGGPARGRFPRLGSVLALTAAGAPVQLPPEYCADQRVVIRSRAAAASDNNSNWGGGARGNRGGGARGNRGGRRVRVEERGFSRREPWSRDGRRGGGGGGERSRVRSRERERLPYVSLRRPAPPSYVGERRTAAVGFERDDDDRGDESRAELDRLEASEFDDWEPRDR